MKYKLPRESYYPGGGGGGVLGIYIGGGVPWHTKKGGLRYGQSPKKGGGSYVRAQPQKRAVLGTSTTRKRGNLGLIW